MRIKNLHLENFRGFESLNIGFPENSNTIVLIGENGSGKTTVLDAIGAAMALMQRSLMYDKNLDYILSEADIKHGCEWFSYECVMEESNGNIFTVQKAIKHPEVTDSIDGKSNIYSSKTKLKAEDNIPILLYIGSKMYNKAANGTPEVGLPQFLANQNAFNAPQSNFQDFKKWYKFEVDLEGKQQLKNKDFSYKSKEIKVIDTAINLFLNEIGADSFQQFRLETITLPQTHIFDTASIDKLMIDKNNQTFEIEQDLSSGEKILIQMVVDITRRLTLANPTLENPLLGMGIVLIDEIDLHLHPKWQRNILSALSATFPNIQFIATTHSPQVLSNLPKGSVFLLENNQLSEKEIFTEGRDSNSILQDAFNISEIKEKYKTELQEIYNLIDVGNAKAAQLKLETLIEKRGENDREVLRMQSYIDFL